MIGREFHCKVDLAESIVCRTRVPDFFATFGINLKGRRVCFRLCRSTALSKAASKITLSSFNGSRNFSMPITTAIPTIPSEAGVALTLAALPLPRSCPLRTGFRAKWHNPNPWLAESLKPHPVNASVSFLFLFLFYFIFSFVFVSPA